MNKKLPVSIGIPAYNEELNILHLMKALLSQKEEFISIKEILVYIDGSTDKTEALLKTLRDPRIKLKIGKTRIGQQERQNQILRDFSGDVIVLLEADILPFNTYTIEELVKPFIGKTNNLGMVIGVPVIIEPKGFYEKILYHGYEIKFRIFADWKEGKNVYTCGGHSMKALSKAFAKKIRWPRNVPEDAYTFLFLSQLGFNLYRQKSAKAYMRNVTNLNDRLRQVEKFRTGKKALLNYFSEDLIEKEYTLPLKLVIKNLLIELFKNPILTTLYFLEVTLNRLLTFRAKKFNALYRPYHSSKVLIDVEERTSR